MDESVKRNFRTGICQQRKFASQRNEPFILTQAISHERLIIRQPTAQIPRANPPKIQT